MPITGIYNIDKPPGLSSRQVVDVVARLVRPHKAGHAGTLDPLATGVLVVCVGRATRLIEYVQRQRKTYQATFLLGRRSDTEDVEGPVVEVVGAIVPDLRAIQSAVAGLTGRIWQRPPAYSALKVGGRRAYRMVRAGQTPELAPRQVDVYGIQIVDYAYPRLELRIECGSGTYVRSLGRDLAAAAGTCAVMAALRRLSVGVFRAENAVPLEELNADTFREKLLSPLLAVGGMRHVRLTPRQQRQLGHGLPVGDADASGASAGEELAAIDERGELVAVVRVAEDGLRPVVNLLPAG